ncbi:ABC transporter ATP-binding protein [Acidobacteriota bacterium]
MNEFLRIENLSKGFRKKTILDRFNMSMDPGKVYGLFGKNGEGKTTLIRMIMGVIPPDSGDIYYKGKKLKYGDSLYKKEIGFIAEDSVFFSWMTVVEVLRFNASFYPTWNKAKVDEYLERLSLDRKVKIRNMSRGMKLKLGLIVALGSEPKFLICDDPTSGLDVPTRQEFIRDIIREIVDAGTTILFSSHLVHELEGIVDEVGILKNGHLIVEEDYQALKDSAKRVTLDFDSSVPADLDLEGILTEKKEENRLEVVVHPWDDEKKIKMDALKPQKMTVDSMSLEDIFVSFVWRNPKSH